MGMNLVEHEYHGIELTKQLPNDIYNWLIDNYGHGDGSRWYMRHNVIYFSNKHDHMMFLIKISGYQDTV
jgi:hypothetical protein